MKRILATVLVNFLTVAALMGLLLTPTAHAGSATTIKNNHIWGQNFKSVVIPFRDRVSTTKSKIFALDGAAVTDSVFWTLAKRIVISNILYWVPTVTGVTQPDGGSNTYVILIEETVGTDEEIGTLSSATLPIIPTQLDSTLTNTRIDVNDTLAITITDSGGAVVPQLMLEIQYTEVEPDITARAIWQPHEKVQIKNIYFTGWGTMTAAASANDIDVTVLDESGNTIVTLAFVAALAVDTPTTLGTISATHGLLSAGEHIELTTAANGTAILPNFALQIDYVLQDS